MRHITLEKIDDNDFRIIQMFASNYAAEHQNCT